MPVRSSSMMSRFTVVVGFFPAVFAFGVMAGGCASSSEPEAAPAPAPQAQLDAIDRRQVAAARSVHSELLRRGFKAFSPIDCGVFPQSEAKPRDSRCNVVLDADGRRDIVVVTLAPDTNAITSWSRLSVAGYDRAIRGWCPGDSKAFESSTFVCGETVARSPNTDPVAG